MSVKWNADVSSYLVLACLDEVTPDLLQSASQYGATSVIL